jgi:hypothetical protein
MQAELFEELPSERTELSMYMWDDAGYRQLGDLGLLVRTPVKISMRRSWPNANVLVR